MSTFVTLLIKRFYFHKKYIIFQKSQRHESNSFLLNKVNQRKVNFSRAEAKQISLNYFQDFVFEII